MSIKIKTPEPLKFDRLNAAINCAHTIRLTSVQLFFEPTEPGHNALNQLGNRLEALEREQLEARDDQWLEMVRPLVEATQRLMTMRVGELQISGYLRDNDISRAALGDLKRALSAITEEASHG